MVRQHAAIESQSVHATVLFDVELLEIRGFRRVTGDNTLRVVCRNNVVSRAAAGSIVEKSLVRAIFAIDFAQAVLRVVSGAEAKRAVGMCMDKRCHRVICQSHVDSVHAVKLHIIVVDRGWFAACADESADILDCLVQCICLGGQRRGKLRKLMLHAVSVLVIQCPIISTGRRITAHTSRFHLNEEILRADRITLRVENH